MVPYVNIHTHRPASQPTAACISVSSYRIGSGEMLPPAPFSAGIHPWDADASYGCLSELPRMLRAFGAVAVGETGLDYSGMHRAVRHQREVFATQLRLAEEYRLPVIIHCVRAFEPDMELLSAHELPCVIFHGYTGSMQQTLRVERAGYCISVGNASLGSPKTAASLRAFPAERLFIETDDSDTPIEAMYRRVSALLEVPLPELKERIFKNFKTVFPDYGVA